MIHFIFKTGHITYVTDVTYVTKISNSQIHLRLNYEKLSLKFTIKNTLKQSELLRR